MNFAERKKELEYKNERRQNKDLSELEKRIDKLTALRKNSKDTDEYTFYTFQLRYIRTLYQRERRKLLHQKYRGNKR